MCGFAAVVGLGPSESRRALDAMCAQMVPRGPDDGGIELLGTEQMPVGLGSRRLAIIDPSRAGHQPMHDVERGTAIVYNGMLYNFRELRTQLEHQGERFTSDCDTEVVLRAYGRYGADCVHHLQGMFAFAIWDARRGELFLARDRLGIKPLYYRHDGRRFACASAAKALVAGGLAEPRLSAAGIDSYLTFGAVTEPLTAIEDVFQLPSGHRAYASAGAVRVESYWTPTAGDASPPPAEAAAELRRLLEESVARHLVSDAPLGVFLSGGLDSSILATIAARVTDTRTISVVFDEPGLSEAPYSRLVAARARTQHEELRLDASSTIDSLGDAFAAMDQPTFDGLNTFVVARAAAEAGLKVALSGLGADELFGAYGLPARIRRLEQLRGLPRPVASAAARVARRLWPGSRGEKTAAWLDGSAKNGSYVLLRRLFSPRDRVQLGIVPGNPPDAPLAIDAQRDLFNQVSVLELRSYMRNVLLRDADAMGMGNSVEVRVPYLDDNLVEWALGLGGHVKERGSKALLGEATADILPRGVATRAKRGFLLPLGSWLRNELADDVAAGLARLPESTDGLIDPSGVERVWGSFRAGSASWLRPWSLYALGRWAETLPAATKVVR